MAKIAEPLLEECRRYARGEITIQEMSDEALVASAELEMERGRTTANTVFVACGEHLVASGDLIITAEELAREPTPDARRQLLKRKASNFEGSMAERLRELGYEVA